MGRLEDQLQEIDKVEEMIDEAFPEGHEEREAWDRRVEMCKKSAENRLHPEVSGLLSVMRITLRIALLDKK